MTIKLILIFAACGATYVVFRRTAPGQRLALRRLGFLVFVGSWLTAVLAPDAVTWLAHAVGVGRGADLVLYLLTVAFMFSSLTHQQQMRRMDERIATLVRAIAVSSADETRGARKVEIPVGHVD